MRKILLIGICVVFLAGCFFDEDDDGPTSSEDKQLSNLKADSATALLEEMIFNMAQNGEQPDPQEMLDAMDVSEAHALFLEALDKNPDNNDAHLGIAMTNMMKMAQNDSVQALIQEWGTM